MKKIFITFALIASFVVTPVITHAEEPTIDQLVQYLVEKGYIKQESAPEVKTAIPFFFAQKKADTTAGHLKLAINDRVSTNSKYTVDLTLTDTNGKSVKFNQDGFTPFFKLSGTYNGSLVLKNNVTKKVEFDFRGLVKAEGDTITISHITSQLPGDENMGDIVLVGKFVRNTIEWTATKYSNGEIEDQLTGTLHIEDKNNQIVNPTQTQTSNPFYTLTPGAKYVLVAEAIDKVSSPASTKFFIPFTGTLSGYSLDVNDIVEKHYYNNIEDNTVKITSIYGGEKFALGSQTTISWTTTGVDPKEITRVYLGKKDGEGKMYHVIANTTADAGSVPLVFNDELFKGRGGIPLDGVYTILVEVGSSIVENHPYARTESYEFSIVNPSNGGGGDNEEKHMLVTYPFQGENFKRGNTEVIKWSSNQPEKTVRLELRRSPLQNSPTDAIVIAEEVPNTGSYSWKVGQFISGQVAVDGQYLVEVCTIGVGGLCDQSDRVITLGSSNDGGNGGGGEVSNEFKATVTRAGENSPFVDSSTVTIPEISPEGVSNAIFYGNATGGTAPYTYYWDLGNGNGYGQGYTTEVKQSVMGERFIVPGDYKWKFKVVDAAGKVSERLFTVTVLASNEKPIVTISYPNGGESYKPGDSLRVYFSTVLRPGTKYNVVLVNPTTNPTQYQLLTTGTVTYEDRQIGYITIPQANPDSNYKIEVSPVQPYTMPSWCTVTHACVLNDYSDNTFSIVAAPSNASVASGGSSSSSGGISISSVTPENTTKGDVKDEVKDEIKEAVAEVKPMTMTLVANGAENLRITTGYNIKLSWKAENATSCTNTWDSSKEVSGVTGVTATPSISSYTLTCNSAAGESMAKTVVVTVTDPAQTE